MHSPAGTMLTTNSRPGFVQRGHYNKLFQVPSMYRHTNFRLTVLSRAQQTPEDVVNLDFNGREEKLTLCNGRIQVSAVKEAFGLATVKINDRIEPVDERGFTVTCFSPHSTVKVTGQPTQELACMFGEIAALRADIRQLQQLRCDLKDSAGLRGEMAELKKDLTATKRLVAEIVHVGVQTHKADSPDFTRTSQDGYTLTPDGRPSASPRTSSMDIHRSVLTGVLTSPTLMTTSWPVACTTHDDTHGDFTEQVVQHCNTIELTMTSMSGRCHHGMK